MSKKPLSRVWEYFENTDSVNKVTQCKICKSKLSFRTTSGNLKVHLRGRHKEAYATVFRQPTSTGTSRSNDSVDNPKSSKQRNNLDLLLWNYFERENYYEETAKCNICLEVLSYKNTKNLKTHLQINHLEEYNEYLQDIKPPCDRSMVTELTQIEAADDLSANASSSNQGQGDESTFSRKFCAEVWEQFEIRDSTAYCTICCYKTTDNTIEDMKNHLEEEHPLVLTNILKRDTDSTDAESVQNDEADIFTEVVYLEEAKSRKSLKRKRVSPDRTEETSSTIETEEEISSFLNYVSVLLKKVNKRSLSKLQVDIINLISRRSDGRYL